MRFVAPLTSIFSIFWLLWPHETDPICWLVYNLHFFVKFPDLFGENILNLLAPPWNDSISASLSAQIFVAFFTWNRALQPKISNVGSLSASHVLNFSNSTFLQQCPNLIRRESWLNGLFFSFRFFTEIKSPFSSAMTQFDSGESWLNGLTFFIRS